MLEKKSLIHWNWRLKKKEIRWFNAHFCVLFPNFLSRGVRKLFRFELLGGGGLTGWGGGVDLAQVSYPCQGGRVQNRQKKSVRYVDSSAWNLRHVPKAFIIVCVGFPRVCRKLFGRQHRRMSHNSLILFSCKMQKFAVFFLLFLTNLATLKKQ